MVEATQADFSFESFKVPKFSYDEYNHHGDELKLGFLPSGRFFSDQGVFELNLKFATHDIDPDKTIFELTAVARFKFETIRNYEELPEFFYKNAVAIMFPYVRAFISTLTLQANTKLLKLGLMNLSGLESTLKTNTVVVK